MITYKTPPDKRNDFLILKRREISLPYAPLIEIFWWSKLFWYLQNSVVICLLVASIQQAWDYWAT